MFAAIADAGWVGRLRELHLITPIRIVIVLILAWVAGVVIRHVVVRFVRGLLRAQNKVTNRADDQRNQQRRNTLTTVLKSSALALIWITAAITVIGELGINLGAFVATATIIGGALAFGAQTLVRDLIAGFFMIAENQFAVGDLVDAGTTVGVVEKVSLRVTRISDDQGRVWYLPNGQITRVANLSQGNGASSVDVTVGLVDDLSAVGARLLEIANALRGHSVVGPLISGEPEFMGVEELHPRHAVLRVVIPCRPTSQAAVRRAFFCAVAETARLGKPGDPKPLYGISGDIAPTI